MSSNKWNVDDLIVYEGEPGLVLEVDNTTDRGGKQWLLVEFAGGLREFLASNNVERPQ